MQYLSYADLSRVTVSSFPLLPRDTDLVVGTSTAAMMAGSMIALSLQRPLLDLATFLSSRNSPPAREAFPPGQADNVPRRNHVLIVHEPAPLLENILSVWRALSLHDFPTLRFTHFSPLATRDTRDQLDIAPGTAAENHACEWHLFHHDRLNNACLDIDGVLCVDPGEDENDDGPRYRDFLLNARPFLLPSRPVRHLVTSRLEKWRKETELWLHRHGVRYEKLSMIDLPTASERRRIGAHSTHKAAVYTQDTEATLFIESELHQARLIAQHTRKPVLCIANQKIYLGTSDERPALFSTQQLFRLPHAVASRVKRMLMF